MATVPLLFLLLFVFFPAVQNSLTTFNIIKNSLTQTAAQTACRTNYTDLVTLYSDEDNAELVNVMKMAGISAGWIGLYRGQSSAKWSNGDAVTFSSLTGDCGTGDCCTAMKADASWESLNCADKRYFMCYEEDESCSPLIYHLILMNMSWYDAQRYCRQNYTDLVSIRDQKQNEEVKIKGGNSSTSFWIGLLYDDWEWSDGGRSAYRNWGTGSPKPSPSNCVRLLGGKWYSVSCSNTNPALCSYSNVTVFSPAVQNRLTTFNITKNKLNQTAAQTACRTNYTDLVTLYSDEDNAELFNVMNMAGISTGWIGLYRGQSSAKWSNGDAVTFSSLTGECGTGDCCTAMKADASWESLNCTDKRYFMCYEADDVLHAPIYHLILVNMSWYDAQRYCRQNYADLVSIRDQDQNEEVKIKGGNSGTSFWIGLLYDDWEWSDGGRSVYRNWKCNGTQLYDCVKLMKGKWISAPCSDTDFSLCYRTSIHVSDYGMSWERALDYCKKENRKNLFRIENDLDKKELERQLRRRSFSWPVWVGLGQSLISELLRSSSRLALGPWTSSEGVKQPQPPLSPSHKATENVGVSDQQMDVSELKAVCEV